MSGASSTADPAASTGTAAAAGAPARKPLTEKDEQKWKKLLTNTELLDQIQQDSAASRFYDHSVSIGHGIPSSTT
jgi:hypothetical protein